MRLDKMHRGADMYEKEIRKKPACVSELSQTQLNIELEKGYQDMLQEKNKVAELIFEELSKE